MFKRHEIPIMNQMSPNSTCSFGGFHLSYNPDTRDYGSVTTAIVIGNHALFFILNGDHRKPLHAAGSIDGLQGCIDYFIDHIAQANFRSDHVGVLTGQELFDIAKHGLELLGQPNVDRLSEAVKALQATSDRECEADNVDAPSALSMT